VTGERPPLPADLDWQLRAIRLRERERGSKPTPTPSRRAGLPRMAAAQARTHCRRGHLYTEESTYVTPSTGRRTCRICMRESRGAGERTTTRSDAS
jgi:hypothetical protein